MPRDGAGNHSLPWPDFQSGTTISSQQVDDNNADISAALTGSMPRNGEAAATSNIPMGGFRFTTVGNALLRSQFATAQQVQDDALCWGGTTGGISTAYTATIAPAIDPAYVDGMRVRLRIHTTNGAGATLSINGVAAKTLAYFNRGVLSNLPAGVLVEGSIVECCYPSAAVDRWIVLSTLARQPGMVEMAQSVNASPQSTVIFPIPAGTFGTFQLRITDCVPAANAAPFLRFSYDGGVSFTSSPFDYGYSYMSVASGAVTGATATSSFCQLGEAAASTIFGTIDINSGAPTRGIFALTTYKPGPLLNYSSGGFNGPNAVATHVQFGFVGQNVQAHRIKLFGDLLP